MKPAHRFRTLVATLLLASACSAYAAKKAPPIEDLSKYPAQDTHAKEGVTIAIDPFDTRSRADFFRIDYVGHGIIPIRFILRNDSDHPLSLTDVRVQLIPSEGDKLPAALPTELNRRLFRIRDTQRKSIPGVPIITYKKAPVDKKILQDQEDFGINTTTVAPHSTLEGFLFYDINDLDDANSDPLKGAEIYVKQIMTSDTKSQLFPFSISLDKYLQSKPKTVDTKRK